MRMQATPGFVKAHPMAPDMFDRNQNANTVKYRGTSLIRNCHPIGPYSRPRALGYS